MFKKFSFFCLAFLIYNIFQVAVASDAQILIGQKKKEEKKKTNYNAYL